MPSLRTSPQVETRRRWRLAITRIPRLIFNQILRRNRSEEPPTSSPGQIDPPARLPSPEPRNQPRDIVPTQTRNQANTPSPSVLAGAVNASIRGSHFSTVQGPQFTFTNCSRPIHLDLAAYSG